MIKRRMVVGVPALALINGTGLSATAPPATGGPVVLANQPTLLLDTPPPAGGELGRVEQFLQQLFEFLFRGGSFR